MEKILAMILAGGEGTRLEPLTRDRAKPAVPFGGKYRIIDIVLSNFVNSGIYNLAVLTQFKAESLIDHIETSWQMNMGNLAGEVTINPAQQRVSQDWYLGTADAVYQNFNRLEKVSPDLVAIFGGDHIYKMDVRDMVSYHYDRGADMTISAIPAPVEKAANTYGVIVVDEDYNVIEFQEKPDEPTPIPGDPARCLVSMGNYMMSRELVKFAFAEDAKKEYVSKDKLKLLLDMDPGAQDNHSTHDIGFDIIPFLHKSGLRLSVYDFARNRTPGVEGAEVCAPAKFALTSEIYNSVISEGCIISQGRVINSVLGYNVRVEVGASVSFTVLFNGASVGREARLRRTIVDKYVEIPPGVQIGFDPEEDEARGFTVAPGGITVVPKRYKFE